MFRLFLKHFSFKNEKCDKVKICGEFTFRPFDLFSKMLGSGCVEKIGIFMAAGPRAGFRFIKKVNNYAERAHNLTAT